MKNNFKSKLKQLDKRKIIFTLLILLIALSFSTAALTPVSRYDNKTAQYRIYLSPSNQYRNTYADNTTNEMEQCDKIAAATKEKLEAYGFNVMLGKSGDRIENRCIESDNFNADLHVPIHTNALNGDYTGGTFVFVLGENEYQLAEDVLSELAPLSPGNEDRIEFKPALYEINTPKAETVYIECEFHDTSEGCEFIKNNTDKIAQAIADGIYKYFSDKE